MIQSKPPSSPVPTAEAKELFLQCLQADDEPSRHRMLEAADPAISEEVRRLLVARDRGRVIDQVFDVAGGDEHSGLDVTADSRADASDSTGAVSFDVFVERPGTTIGNYKLLEQIGEGGMGTVFMAQQTEPVRRRVAVKIVKPGLDSRQVIARFEAERQALAMMDHPHIARVFDGGATEHGRPYFVMELVKGIPLTDFCQRKNLPIRDRLQLFVDVCRAVQHAHQRGIIHRDLKPSNVMVTLHDDRPVVKIIDFGIAKAMNQELTDKTLFTQFAAMIGTPLYMSPEQAELSGLDVDTRSDVYSLGVMLYELLTDTTPFAQETLKRKGIDEVRRLIRETEPPRPSQRISTVKASRGETTDNDRLRKIKRNRSELSGELDWIAVRALEKDRERRYQSASDFADDLQRYLNGETVQACPPSFRYRLRKYVRRHRGLVTTAALVLTTATIGSIVSLRLAQQAKTEAGRAAVEAEKAEDNFNLAVDAVDKLVNRVADSDLREHPMTAPVAAKVMKDALDFYEDLSARSPDNLELWISKVKAKLDHARYLADFGQVLKGNSTKRAVIDDLEQKITLHPNNRRIALLLTKARTEIGWQNDRQSREARLTDFHRAYAIAMKFGFDVSAEPEERLAYVAARNGYAYNLEPEKAVAILTATDADRRYSLKSLMCAEIFSRAGDHDTAIRIIENELESGTTMGSGVKPATTRAGRYGRMLGIGNAVETAIPIDLQVAKSALDHFFEDTKKFLDDYPHAQRYRYMCREHLIKIYDRLNRYHPSETQSFVQKAERVFGLELSEPIRFLHCIEQEDFDQASRNIEEFLALENNFFNMRLYYFDCLLAAWQDNEELLKSLYARFNHPQVSNDGYMRCWAKALHELGSQSCSALSETVDSLLDDTAADRHQRLVAVGAVHFRAGHLETALEHFNLARQSPAQYVSPAYEMYFRSMTLHRLGRPEEAESVLSEANELAEDELSDPNQPPAWNRRMTIDVLRREAEVMIGSDG